MRGPLRFGYAVGLAATAFVAAPAAVAAERIHDNDGLNYELRVDETWEWKPVDPALKEKGVVEVADRVLALLADGKTPGEGQGARVMLSVQSVPATLDSSYETYLKVYQDLLIEAGKVEPVPEELGKKLDDARAKVEKTLTAWVTAQADVQELLLSRFDRDPKRWPKPKIDGEAKDIARSIPDVELRVTANSANLAGVVAPCEGRMFVFVVRKQVYRLAMWAWPTPKDGEHLINDLDMIELSFDLPKKEAIAKRPDAAPGDGGMDGANGGPNPDAKPEGKREIIHDLPFGFEVAKPAKLTARVIDRTAQADKQLGFEFKAQSGQSDVFIDLQVYSTMRSGGQGAALNVKTYLAGLWSSYLKQHSEGTLGTAPFPTYSEKAGFLVLPDMAKKKEIKRPAEADKDKNFTVGDMERAGVVEEVKGVKLGKVKLHDTWRYCMTGNEPRRGEDIQLQYCFSTPDRILIIRVIARKEGWATWKDDIADVLKSFAIMDDPPK